MMLSHTPLYSLSQVRACIANQPLLAAVVQSFHQFVQAIKQPTELWLVGGAVRDAFQWGTLGADWDVVPVGLSPTQCEEWAQQLATTLSATWVPLHPEWGMQRVVISLDAEGPIFLDISACQGLTLNEDLARRDLTCNAMAVGLVVPPDSKTWLDPFNGLHDLSAGCIRAVSQANLVDDPLRLLRVYRLAATTQATRLDADTEGWVAAHAHRLWQAAPERITTEWLRLLSAAPCSFWLQAMGRSGLLEVLLPELSPTRQIPPNSHHHLPLWEHSLELVHQAETAVFTALPPALQNDLTVPLVKGYSGAGITRQGLIHWGCLLHDVGKPDTHQILEDGRHAFHGHDRVGEAITQAIAERFKLGREWTQTLCMLVRWHLYPCAFSPRSSRKSLLKCYRRLGHRTEDVLVLAMADRLSTRGPSVTTEQVTSDMADLHGLLADYQAFRPTLQQPPLLTGHEVMATLGLLPGPAVGQVLQQVRDRQLLGELQSSQEAIDWIQQQALASLLRSTPSSLQV
ncbi:MAG: HD domain-containing protein [Vampirovibrionales bacterium]